jgi:ferrous iron transport protein A
MVLPLGLLSVGERAEVSDIKSRGKHQRLEELGLRKGKEVEVLNTGHPGPFLIKIDETRLAIGHGIAMKIMVDSR